MRHKFQCFLCLSAILIVGGCAGDSQPMRSTNCNFVVAQDSEQDVFVRQSAARRLDTKNAAALRKVLAARLLDESEPSSIDDVFVLDIVGDDKTIDALELKLKAISDGGKETTLIKNVMQSIRDRLSGRPGIDWEK